MPSVLQQYQNEKLAHTIFNPEDTDAYRLSMPLLASALAQDDALYNKVLPLFERALEEVKEKNLYPWLLGRALAAADRMKDYKTSEKVRAALQCFLDERLRLQDAQVLNDACFAWSIGYIAASTGELYKKYKDVMLNATQALTKLYQNKKDAFSLLTPQEQGPKEQKILSNLATDAMWAWVMALQAAACANDKEGYEYIISQMKDMTGQSSLGEALVAGIVPEDFQAWALAIAILSAATIMGEDTSLYDALQIVLSEALESVSASDSQKNNVVLARLTQAVAAEALRERNEQQPLPQSQRLEQ